MNFNGSRVVNLEACGHMGKDHMGRLGQRPVGVDVDALASDVDLGGLFPAAAEGSGQ